MAAALIVVPAEETALAPYKAQVLKFVQQSRAANTLRAYRSDWRDFQGWCAALGLASLPAAPEAIASYLTTVADHGLKAGSIQRRVSAIAAMHTARRPRFTHREGSGQADSRRHPACLGDPTGSQEAHIDDGYLRHVLPHSSRLGWHSRSRAAADRLRRRLPGIGAG